MHHEKTLNVRLSAISQISLKISCFFVISQISLKINTKPETTLLGAEGEEKKHTHSFHTEKRATSESAVSGSSVSSD